MAKKSQESKVKKAKSQKPDSSIKKEAQVKETPEEKKPVKKTLAKAGKRSQKAIAEE